MGADMPDRVTSIERVLADVVKRLLALESQVAEILAPGQELYAEAVICREAAKGNWGPWRARNKQRKLERAAKALGPTGNKERSR